MKKRKRRSDLMTFNDLNRLLSGKIIVEATDPQSDSPGDSDDIASHELDLGINFNIEEADYALPGDDEEVPVFDASHEEGEKEEDPRIARD